MYSIISMQNMMLVYYVRMNVSILVTTLLYKLHSVRVILDSIMLTSTLSWATNRWFGIFIDAWNDDMSAKQPQFAETEQVLLSNSPIHPNCRFVG